MFVLSLNFKKADQAFRECFAFDEKKTLRLLDILRENGINESVYLSTCNRCELYGTGDAYAALRLLADFAGIPADAVKNHIFIYDEKDAVMHLFRVSCGFESMVLGEDEILGQIKKAFAFSQQHGATGYQLNTIFKGAVTSAKRIKTQTRISKSAVSVATLAASECHRTCGVSKNILLLGGSGEIGGRVLKNLISYGEFEIYAAAREKHISGKNVHVIPYSDRYEYMDRADIVISATKSPHFTVVCGRLEGVLKESKPRLFIDLAVPHDIDEDVKKLPEVTLMQVDDFNEIAERNSEIKHNEIIRGEDIIRADIDDLLKELSFHRIVPKLQNLENDELRSFIYDFRDNADAEELEHFINVFLKMAGNV
jgi:glutamyl-tRNA reductase